MIVVSDTSVISGPIQSGNIFILQKLYKKVIVPNEVFAGLGKLDSRFLSPLSEEWIEVRQISNVSFFAELLSQLDPG